MRVTRERITEYLIDVMGYSEAELNGEPTNNLACWIDDLDNFKRYGA